MSVPLVPVCCYARVTCRIAHSWSTRKGITVCSDPVFSITLSSIAHLDHRAVAIVRYEILNQQFAPSLIWMIVCQGLCHTNTSMFDCPIRMNIIIPALFPFRLGMVCPVVSSVVEWHCHKSSCLFLHVAARPNSVVLEELASAIPLGLSALKE